LAYQDGKGVSKDYAKAIDWYRKAADTIADSDTRPGEQAEAEEDWRAKHGAR
jgi:hypothetical protein